MVVCGDFLCSSRQFRFLPSHRAFTLWSIQPLGDPHFGKRKWTLMPRKRGFPKRSGASSSNIETHVEGKTEGSRTVNSYAYLILEGARSGIYRCSGILHVTESRQSTVLSAFDGCSFPLHLEAHVEPDCQTYDFVPREIDISQICSPAIPSSCGSGISRTVDSVAR
jgi:hypothetical protein